MDLRGKRAVIVSGGSLGDWTLQEIGPNDQIIGVDRGALFLIRHGITPHVAIGDFDSVTAQELEEIRSGSTHTEACDPVHKNWTDTEWAFHWALAQQPAEIVLVGALGTRFDHSLANVHLLSIALRKGVACAILDKHNRIVAVNRSIRLKPDPRYAQVSLLPLTMEVTGITLEGFQYPLNDATLTIGDSLGISNVLLADEGLIRVKEGVLLVICSID